MKLYGVLFVSYTNNMISIHINRVPVPSLSTIDMCVGRHTQTQCNKIRCNEIEIHGHHSFSVCCIKAALLALTKSLCIIVRIYETCHTLRYAGDTMLSIIIMFKSASWRCSGRYHPTCARYVWYESNNVKQLGRFLCHTHNSISSRE